MLDKSTNRTEVVATFQSSFLSLLFLDFSLAFFFYYYYFIRYLQGTLYWQRQLCRLALVLWVGISLAHWSFPIGPVVPDWSHSFFLHIYFFSASTGLFQCGNLNKGAFFFHWPWSEESWKCAVLTWIDWQIRRKNGLECLHGNLITLYIIYESVHRIEDLFFFFISK